MNLSAQEQNVVNTLVNALGTPNTALAASAIHNARRNTPALYNIALRQFNQRQQQAGRPLSNFQPIAMANQSPAPAENAVTVNTQQQQHSAAAIEEDQAMSGDIIESDDNDYSDFDEEIATSPEFIPVDEDASDEEESIDEDSEELPVDEDFIDDDVEKAVDEEFVHATSEDELLPEQPIPMIESLTFRHSVQINIFLNEEQGSIYTKGEGAAIRYFTTKQPLRRGRGVENDATGAARASLEAFIEGVKAEGEGISFAVAVPENYTAEFVSQTNSDIEERLYSFFDEEANIGVFVSSTLEDSETPWGGKTARIVHRSITLNFSIPAIVSSARKGKDAASMLASNLKIVRNLTRSLNEATTLEQVGVNLMIAQEVIGDLLPVFTNMVAKNATVKFTDGYACVSVDGNNDDSSSSEE